MIVRFLLPLLLSFSLIPTLNAAEYEQTPVPVRLKDIKSFSVVAPVWDEFTNTDGTGLYWEVLRAIYEPANITVKTANVPWHRGMKMVTKYRVYNAIVGEDKSTEEDVLFTDYAIDVEYSSVLSLSTRNLDWNGPSSLSGKNVGWMKDYNLIEPEDRDFSLHEYRTVEQGLEMLESGALDYMIEEWDEIAEVVADTKREMTTYRMDEMPEGSDVFVVFASGSISEALIKVYNENLPIIYKSGQLNAIYEKWGHDIPRSVIDALNQ